MVWDLLHLTDVHYGEAFDDDDKTDVDRAFRENARLRLPPVMREWEQVVGLPTAMLISGDLTVRGDEGGLRECTTAIQPLVKSMSQEQRIVCIVPGNHDVTWGAPDDRDGLQQKFQVFRSVIAPMSVGTCLFPRKSQRGDLEFDPIGPNRGPVLVDRERRLVVLAINSAIRCGERNTRLSARLVKELTAIAGGLGPDRLADFTHWAERQAVSDVAHVTEAQRNKLIEALRLAREEHAAVWQDCLRVAVLHHHLTTFAGQKVEHKPFELTVDAHQVLQLLADFDFQLVLTGHKHQPYVEQRVVPTANGPATLMVAGGPTVLGDTSGGAARGMRRFRISRQSNSRTFDMTVDEIHLEEQHPTEEALRRASSKTHTLRGRETRALCVVGEEIRVDLRGATRVSLRSDDDDHSDEWMIFLNVVSCDQARKDIDSVIGNLPSEIKSQLRYISVYDLYGRYDILFRFVGPDETAAEEIKRRVLEQIDRGTPDNFAASESCRFVNVTDMKYFKAESGHTVWAQDRFEHERRERAFLVATRVEGGPVTSYDWESACHRTSQALDAIEETDRHRGHPKHGSVSWCIHRSHHAFIVEALLSCGRYYDLREVTRALESDFLDDINWSKETHIAYEHDERVLGHYAKQIAESVAKIEKHRFVVDGNGQYLTEEQIRRWIYCAGRESRTFPALLKQAEQVAKNEALRAVLRNNLRDEEGAGDPSEAHFQHYLRLLEQLGIKRSTFENYVPGQGLNNALRTADKIKSSSDATILGYLLVNEALTPVIYRAVEHAIRKYTPDVSQRTQFFQLHIDGDKEHVHQLSIAGDQLRADKRSEVEAGIKQATKGMLDLLTEAWGGTVSSSAPPSPRRRSKSDGPRGGAKPKNARR